MMLDIHIALKILRAASNVPFHSKRHALTHETFTFNSYSKRAVFRPDGLQILLFDDPKIIPFSSVLTLFVRRKCTTLRADDI